MCFWIFLGGIQTVYFVCVYRLRHAMSARGQAERCSTAAPELHLVAVVFCVHVLLFALFPRVRSLGS